MSKYIGIFNNRNSVAREFEYGAGDRFSDNDDDFVPAEDFPTDEEIIVAAYEYESYSGDAFVVFKHEGKLFEVIGGHCSCRGLEGQWKPEETTVEALRMRPETDGYGVQCSPTVHQFLAPILRRQS